jgi:hypothetical protein
MAVNNIFGATGCPRNAPVWAAAPVNTAESPYLCTCVSDSFIDANSRFCAEDPALPALHRQTALFVPRLPPLAALKILP